MLTPSHPKSVHATVIPWPPGLPHFWSFCSLISGMHPLPNKGLLLLKTPHRPPLPQSSYLHKAQPDFAPRKRNWDLLIDSSRTAGWVAVGTVHHFLQSHKPGCSTSQVKFILYSTRVCRLTTVTPGRPSTNENSVQLSRLLKTLWQEYGGTLLAGIYGARHFGRPAVQPVFLPYKTCLVAIVTPLASVAKGNEHALVHLGGILVSFK